MPVASPPATSASPAHDDLRDGVPPGLETIRRLGHTFAVRGRLVPRRLFTTASLDVWIDGCCVLRSGGVPQAGGRVEADVELNDGAHVVALAWGTAKGAAFPVVVTLDGVVVEERDVEIDNTWLLLVFPVVVAVCIGIAAWLLGR